LTPSGAGGIVASLSRVHPDPGRKEPSIAELEIGAVVEGTVQRITPYGAFIQIDDGPVGLIHVSQIDRNYVREVRDHLRENDRVQAKVVSIKEDGKIDLSIKALQDPPDRPLRKGRDPDLERKLKQFMRQSEERQVDFRRATDHKRR
jgi:S1 RNA binding domain protein